MTYLITLRGPIPSKKNRLVPRFGGKGLFQGEKEAGAIAALMWQVREQWGGNSPLMRPAIEAYFDVLDARSDLDNKWVTVSDVLVKAGVLKDDNIKHLPGPITIRGQIASEEKVDIELSV